MVDFILLIYLLEYDQALILLQILNLNSEGLGLITRTAKSALAEASFSSCLNSRQITEVGWAEESPESRISL